MKRVRINLSPRALLLGLSLAGLALPSGCGGDERMESGTQVEVSDGMLQDAAASDAYFDQQAEGKTP